eukprot:scaffold49429_cov30-Prasinocladus_malaysianus.AAC.2
MPCVRLAGDSARQNVNLGAVIWPESSLLDWAASDSGVSSLTDLGIPETDSFFAAIPWHVRDQYHYSPCNDEISTRLSDANATAAIYTAQVSNLCLNVSKRAKGVCPVRKAFCSGCRLSC